MKRILIIFFATSHLLACNAINDKAGKTDADPNVVKHAAHENEHEGLTLNNGAKWKTDSATALNVSALQRIVATANKESLDEFLRIAAQLQHGLNKMVNECKMKGADHDALHLWLEPLMKKTKELKNETTTENAAKALIGIEAQISLFAQYFE